MSEWPLYVSVAADVMGYRSDDPGDRGIIEAFSNRWGGFGADALGRAFRDATGDEWHFAMELLIDSASPVVREQVVALLDDADPTRRKLASVYLGTLHDRRAVPPLCALLATDFAPTTSYLTERLGSSPNEGERQSAAYLLGQIGDKACVPSLRRALTSALNVEQALKPPEKTDPQPWLYQNAVDALHMLQDTCVYSLGRLDAFGALTGLMDAGVRTDLWRIHLVLGHLHGRHALARVMRLRQSGALADVRAYLENVFGLSEADIDAHVRRYDVQMMQRLSTLYAAEEAARSWRM